MVVNIPLRVRLSPMNKTPSLPLALRWLIEDSDLTEREVAVLAGVSPGAIRNLLQKPNDAVLVWMRFARALRCSVLVRTSRQEWTIPLPKPDQAARVRGMAQWRKRRTMNHLRQVLHQWPDLDRKEAEQKAIGYTSVAEERITAELLVADERLAGLAVSSQDLGMRGALRLVANRARVNAEDLSLLAGLSLGAAQAVVDDTDEGRLALPLRLFSALGAQLILRPGGGGEIVMAAHERGAWRPEPPRAGRSSMSLDEIRRQAPLAKSLADLARRAGVSRQRISAILKKSAQPTAT